MPRRRVRALVLLVATLAALGAAEVVLARAAPQPTYGRLDVSCPRCFRPSDHLPYELLPGARTRVAEAEFDVAVSVNGQGLRMDREVAREGAPGRRRWLVVGDSFTFGWGTESAQSLPAALERRVTERGASVEVLNMGFAYGFSPDCYYAELRRPPRFEADAVIVAAYVGNDFTVRAETSWDELDEKGLPARISAPTQAVDDLGRWLVRSTLLRYRLPVLRDSHLFIGLARALNRGVPTTGAEYAAVSARVHDPSFYTEQWPPDMERSFADIVRCLAGLRDVVASRGQRFVVALIPTFGQVYTLDRQRLPDGRERVGIGLRAAPADEVPQRRLRAALAAANVDLVDLLPGLVAAHEHGLYFQQDQHLTARGAEVAARVLAQALEERGWLR